MRVIEVTVHDAPYAMRARGRRRWPHGEAALMNAQPSDAANAVQRVLRNGPMPNGQRALLRALYEAGQAGLTGPELAAQLDRDEQQLGRLLARLGRRVRRTPGAAILQRPGITLMLDITPAEGQWRYKLRGAVRQALDAQKPEQQ